MIRIAVEIRSLLKRINWFTLGNRIMLKKASVEKKNANLFKLYIIHSRLNSYTLFSQDILYAVSIQNTRWKSSWKNAPVQGNS